MRRMILLAGLAVASGLCAGLALGELASPAGAPVALRVEQFTVPPATGPVGAVVVRNLGRAAWSGKVTIDFGEGWMIEQPSKELHIEPGGQARAAYTVKKAKVVEANRYPVRVVASGPGGEAVREQVIACASAPYGKVRVDGNGGDWGGAIPVTFEAGGKAAVVRTLWTRRTLSMLVSVAEDKLVRMAPGGKRACDAVQVAISRWPAETPRQGGKAVRHEFLLASTNDGPRCFRLVQPGEELAAQPRVESLAERIVDRAELAIIRRGGRTVYEWSVPFRSLTTVRPSVGRTICLSVLVHDPDGTGLRDYGSAAGLWRSQRNARAWTRWPGSKWPAKAPFDSKIEWGLCSSAQ